MTSFLSILKSIFPRRRDLWIYCLTFLPCAALLIIMGVQSEVPVAYLTKDPLAVFQISMRDGNCCEVYFGLVSNIGILLWCATAAICLFSAFLIYTNQGRWEGAFPLVAAGLFTAWLMLDDMFLLHEAVLRENGVPEKVTYTLYAGFAILYFAASWRTIIKHRASLLLVSLFFLGASIIIDSILHTESNRHVLAEDGAKLLGIAAWAAFHIDLAFASHSANTVTSE